MTNKELYYFLGKCLSLGDNPEFVSGLKAYILQDSVDWEKFVALASSHLVTPVIYRQFLINNLIDDLPSDLRVYFEEIYFLNRNRNRKLLLQIEEINLTLNSQNICPVYLKGAGNLVDGLYDDPGERMMIDIDILTDGDHFLKTVDILKNIGYYAPDETGVDTGTCQHYPRMMRNEAEVSIEVHRQPVSEKYTGWFNYNYISGDLKQPVDYPGCRVLSDRHKAMLVFIHSQLSHRGHKYGTVSMRDVYDIYLLSKRIKEDEIVIPEAYIQKASDYYYLAGKITGTTAISTGRKHLVRSLFLIRHRLNLVSKTFYKFNMITGRFSVQFDTFLSVFTSSTVRSSVIKKLSSGKWYIKHFDSWMKLLKS